MLQCPLNVLIWRRNFYKKQVFVRAYVTDSIFPDFLTLESVALCEAIYTWWAKKTLQKCD